MFEGRLRSRADSSTSIRRTVATVLSVAAWGLLASALAAAPTWRTLPEMEEPAGITVDPPEVRKALTESADGARAVARLEALVMAGWRELREIDWQALSRFQLEATSAWALPSEPGELVSRILGRDADGHLSVETRGPRLPARFDIVYRYVYVFATYDPLTGDVGEPTVTIRGWIDE
jgi:hypothetical protein